MVRQYTNKVIEAGEEWLPWRQIAEACLMAMSEDRVEDMAREYGWFDHEDEADEDEADEDEADEGEEDHYDVQTIEEQNEIYK